MALTVLEDKVWLEPGDALRLNVTGSKLGRL